MRVGPVVHESMIARRLLCYRHVLVASPTLLKRLGSPATPDALFRYPCAVWCRDANSVGSWRVGERTLEPPAVLAVNDYLHLRNRALAGEVVTELPPFLAAAALRDGHLRAVMPDHPQLEQQVSLLYPVHRHPSSIVRTYLEFCQKSVGQFLEPSNKSDRSHRQKMVWVDIKTRSCPDVSLERGGNEVSPFCLKGRTSKRASWAQFMIVRGRSAGFSPLIMPGSRVRVPPFPPIKSGFVPIT